MGDDGIEDLVRQRLRGLRNSMGYSLDELAARTHLSASTISRIETGRRTISLDLLRPLCDALQTDMATLLDTTTDDDVVIRPVATEDHGRVVWALTRNRGDAGIAALKMRLEPSGQPDDLRVHPGHDWFFVLSGTVVLWLGDREIVVAQGEAAEFSTMTPHGIRGHGRPRRADHDLQPRRTARPPRGARPLIRAPGSGGSVGRAGRDFSYGGSVNSHEPPDRRPVLVAGPALARRAPPCRRRPHR